MVVSSSTRRHKRVMHEESIHSTISIRPRAKGNLYGLLDYRHPGNSDSFGLRVRPRTDVLRHAILERIGRRERTAQPGRSVSFVMMRSADPIATSLSGKYCRRQRVKNDS